MFQFLIGRLAVGRVAPETHERDWFQFLIGRLAVLGLESYPAAAVVF